MTLVEIGLQRFLGHHRFISPFTISYTVNISELASFWLDTFGCTDERTSERSFILAVIANYSDRFSQVISIEECKNTFESWIFDTASQILTINLGLEYNPIFDPLEYLKSVGFCNTSVVYVDDVAFLPIISGSPKISQEQDLINYDSLAYNTGSIQLVTESGDVDYLREMSLFSNDVAMSYLKYDGRSEYTRAELVPIMRYLLDDITIGKTKGKITLQDNRKANNVKLPRSLFLSSDYTNADEDILDKPIPLLFGTATIPAICTNGTIKSGNVTYRAALYLSVLDQIQVKINDKWANVSALSSDAATGTFTLSDSNGRGVRYRGTWSAATNTPTLANSTGTEKDYYLCSASGTVNFGDGEQSIDSGQYVFFSDGEWNPVDEISYDAREARLVGCSGYSASKPSQVISKLEEIGNEIAYTESFFDIAEINAEESSLGAVSVYLDEQEELNEIIRRLQEGTQGRFRYEWNASGLRTIRLDNPGRDPVAFVSTSEILESGEMAIYTDKPTIAASIKISYGNDFTIERRNSVIDESAADEIAKNIRERPQIEFDTFIPSRTAAEARAALEVLRLGSVRRFCDLTLIGEQFLTLRIYDIITIELIDEFRKWVGTWKCQVLKTEPDMVLNNNKVKLLLVEKIADIDDGESLRVTTTGAIRITQSGTDNLRVTK